MAEDASGPNAARVSRETGREGHDVLEAPIVAARVFRESLPSAERYVRLLAGAGVQRGLIGPREAPRLWDRHLLNCAVVAPAFASGATVADVGSGAGLPGLVLAIVRPDLAVTLIEPLLRRIAFLRECVAALELDNVAVHRGRAEDLVEVPGFDYVTARAVAPLARLVTWCLPLLHRGGTLVALKGSSADDEITRAWPVLEGYLARDVHAHVWGDGVVEPPAITVQVTTDRPGGPGGSMPTTKGRAQVRRGR